MTTQSECVRHVVSRFWLEALSGSCDGEQLAPVNVAAIAAPSMRECATHTMILPIRIPLKIPARATRTDDSAAVPFRLAGLLRHFHSGR